MSTSTILLVHQSVVSPLTKVSNILKVVKSSVTSSHSVLCIPIDRLSSGSIVPSLQPHKGVSSTACHPSINVIYERLNDTCNPSFLPPYYTHMVLCCNICMQDPDMTNTPSSIYSKASCLVISFIYCQCGAKEVGLSANHNLLTTCFSSTTMSLKRIN